MRLIGVNARKGELESMGSYAKLALESGGRGDNPGLRNEGDLERRLGSRVYIYEGAFQL